MEFENSKDWAKVYRACNFIEKGVCEYADERVYLSQETLQKCLLSMKGRPVIIDHKSGINPENMHEHAVGYVVGADCNTFNAGCDCQFVIFDDKGKEVIADGYSVSCAYKPLAFGPGGTWHNVPYDREIVDLEFTHLALVQNPRYEDAKVYENAKEENGRWITVKGSRVFIKEGQSIEDAMKDRRKDKSLDQKTSKRKAKLEKIKNEVQSEIEKIYADYEDLKEYFVVDAKFKENYYDDGSDMYAIEVRGELDYKSMTQLGDKLDKMVQKYDKYAYFDQEEPGIMTAVIDFDNGVEKHNAKDRDGREGRWITIKGTHVFIKDGQSVEDAMKEHGFGKSSSTRKRPSTDRRYYYEYSEKERDFIQKSEKRGYTVYKNWPQGELIAFDPKTKIYTDINGSRKEETAVPTDKLKLVSKGGESSSTEKKDSNKQHKLQVKIDDLKSQEQEILRKYWDADEDQKDELQYKLDAIKDERLRLEEDVDGDNLQGKYERDDVDFDPEQLKKDIKAAQEQGHQEIEDIAEFLGLDEDEVRETLVTTEKKSDFKFKTSKEYKSKKHPDGIVLDLIGEDELIKGFEDASKGQTISKELEDKLSKGMQKYQNLLGWSDKFEQMWDEIDDYRDQWKDAQKNSNWQKSKYGNDWQLDQGNQTAKVSAKKDDGYTAKLWDSSTGKISEQKSFEKKEDAMQWAEGKLKDNEKRLNRIKEEMQEKHNGKKENGHWITVHPNGEGSEGRPLFVKEGESVMQAIDRKFGNKKSKDEKREAKKSQTEHSEAVKAFQSLADELRVKSDDIKFGDQDSNKMSFTIYNWGNWHREGQYYDLSQQSVNRMFDYMQEFYQKHPQYKNALYFELGDRQPTLEMFFIWKKKEKNNNKEDMMNVEEFFNKMGEMIEEKLNACKGRRMNEVEDEEDDDDKFEMDGEVYSKKELVNAFKEKKNAEEEKMKAEEEEEKQNSGDEFFNAMEERISQMSEASDKIEVYTQSKGLEHGKKIYG